MTTFDKYPSKTFNKKNSFSKGFFPLALSKFSKLLNSKFYELLVTESILRSTQKNSYKCSYYFQTIVTLVNYIGKSDPRCASHAIMALRAH